MLPGAEQQKEKRLRKELLTAPLLRPACRLDTNHKTLEPFTGKLICTYLRGAFCSDTMCSAWEA